MGFFEGLGATISQKSNEVAAKTRDMVDATSTNGQIAKVKKAIQQKYAELGEKCFLHEQEVEDSFYAEDLQAIQAMLTEVEELNAKVQELKGNSSTGAAKENAGTAGNSFCTACGAKLDAGALFCTSCGTKVE